jgi:hypothetical protein
VVVGDIEEYRLEFDIECGNQYCLRSELNVEAVLDLNMTNFIFHFKFHSLQI